MSFDSINYNVLQIPDSSNHFTAFVSLVVVKNGNMSQSFASASGNENNIPDTIENAKSKAKNDILCSSNTQPVSASTPPWDVTPYTHTKNNNNFNIASEKQLQWIDNLDVTDAIVQERFHKNINELSTKEANVIIKEFRK